MQTGQTLLATAAGHCEPLPVEDGMVLDLKEPYRLYRFLTDLEDILDSVPDDRDRLGLICPLVRRLLDDSSWIQLACSPPDAKKGWSVTMLYDEPGYPLTVQMVAWAAGQASPIHNHGTWGLVAMLDGEEQNNFWQRAGDPEQPDRLTATGDRVLHPGDIITFLPETIHQVQALGDRPTISFNLYGVTEYDQRFRFNLAEHTAKRF